MNPRAQVASKPFIPSVLLPPHTPRWAHVTVQPEKSRIAVFKAGKPQGEIAWIPTGGQVPPICIDGFNADQKYAQKNEAKNITSETMNKINPSLIELTTRSVWAFW